MSRDARIQVLMDKEEQLQAIADAWKAHKESDADLPTWRTLADLLDGLDCATLSPLTSHNTDTETRLGTYNQYKEEQ